MLTVITSEKLFSSKRDIKEVPIMPDKPLTLAKRVVSKLLGRKATIWEYIPLHIRESDAFCIVRYNGRELEQEDLMKIRPKAGDTILITPCPGWESLLVSAIIAVVLTVAYYSYDYFIYQPFVERAEKAGHYGSTYMFDQFRNEAREGTPIAVIYGNHRFAGQYLQTYTLDPGYPNPKEADCFYSLIGACEGPICSVTDFWVNGIAWKDVLPTSNVLGTGWSVRYHPSDPGSSIWISNGVTTSTAASIWTRRGTKDQATIASFNDSIAAISYSTQLLNSSPVTCVGTTACDSMRIKISFEPYGLYQIDSSGYPHSWAVTIGYKYRTHAGPGAWIGNPSNPSGYFDLTYTRRRKDPFPIWIDIPLPSRNTYDLQVVRLSNDSDPTDKTPQFGDSYLKEVQQITQDDFRYPGVALYAVEAVANAQLGGETLALTGIVQGRQIHDMRSAVRFWPDEFVVTASYQTANYAVGAGTNNTNQLTITAPHNLKPKDYITVDTAHDYPDSRASYGTNNSQIYGVTSARVTYDEDSVSAGTGMPATGTWPGKAIMASKVPTSQMIDLIYSKRYGLGNYIDDRMEFNITVTSGTFVAGEDVTGQYSFIGNIASISGTSPNQVLVCNNEEGIPVYGETITGATSGATATVGDIVEFYAIDLASFWEHDVWCNGYVPDGSGVATTVFGTGTAGTYTLPVLGTAGISATDVVVIDRDGTREEVIEVASITPGVLHSYTPLQYTHTLAQADTVEKAERRHQSDIVFDGQMPAWQALQKMAGNSLSWIVKVGNKLYLKPLKSETPQAMISMGNIDRGTSSTFSVSYPPRDIKPTVGKMKFLNRDDEYQEAVAVIEDPLAYTNDEDLIEAQWDCFGVTRYSEAYRIGIRRLKEARYGSSVVEWMQDIDAIDFMPGDVVQIQHDVPGWGTRGGRIVSSTNTTFTVKQTITIGAGTYKVRVRHIDGTEEERTISTGAGDHRVLTVSSAWTSNPVADELFSVGVSVGSQVRIMSIELQENFKAKIRAIRDDENMYVDDIGTIPEYEVSELPDPRALPPDVEDLGLSEGEAVNKDGELKNFIDVNFTKPEHPVYSHSEVYWKEGLGPFDSYGYRRDRTQTLTTAHLEYPEYVAVSEDYIYISDSYNDRIIVLERVGMVFSHTFGTYGTGNDNFKHPKGIAIDGTGTLLYIVDSGNHRVKVHNLAGTYQSEFGTYGTGNTNFAYPTGIALSLTHCYICDTENHRIKKHQYDGTYVSDIGTQGSGNDQFYKPSGICYSATNNQLIICDTWNYRIQKRSGADALTYVSKIGSQGYGTDLFTAPRGCATDDTTIWVSDGNYYNGTLYSRMMLRNYSDLSASSEWPSDGIAGPGNDQFYLPMGIALSPSLDNYYVADRQNCRVVQRNVDPITNDDWHYVGETYSGWIQIAEAFDPGKTITVSVVSVSMTGMKKQINGGVQESLDVRGKGLVPDDVPNLYFNTISQVKGRVWWNKSEDPHTASFEIRRGSDWQTGQVVATNLKTTYYEVPWSFGVTVKYWIKAVNTGGVYSANATSVTTSMTSTTTVSGTNSHTVTAGNIKTG